MSLSEKNQDLLFKAYQNGYDYRFLAFKYGISEPETLNIIERRRQIEQHRALGTIKSKSTSVANLRKANANLYKLMMGKK